MVAYSTADRVALGKIKNFALLGIVGIILGFVIPLFTLDSALGLASVSTATISSVANIVEIYSAIAIVGVAIGIVSIVMVRSAFKTLAPVDSQFGTPSTMVLGMFAAMVLAIVAVIALIGFAFSIASQVAANPGVTPNFSGILVFSGLIILAGISWLVGIIGIILGLWRTGTRYNEGLLKIGGIFYIIPLLDIVAPILVYLGASSAEKKVGQPA